MLRVIVNISLKCANDIQRALTTQRLVAPGVRRVTVAAATAAAAEDSSRSRMNHVRRGPLGVTVVSRQLLASRCRRRRVAVVVAPKGVVEQSARKRPPGAARWYPRARQVPEVAAAVGVAAAGVAAAAGNPVKSARRRRKSAARRLDLDPRAGGRLAYDSAVPRGRPVLRRIARLRVDVCPVAEVATAVAAEATSAEGASRKSLFLNISELLLNSLVLFFMDL